MNRLCATILALVLCATPMSISAAPSEFDRIVRALEAQTGVPRLHVGFSFLMRAVTWLARPAGASDLQTAVFTPTDGRRGFSSEAFEDALTRTLDSSWHLTLRTTNNADASRVSVWVRPEEKRMELMMVAAQTNTGVLTRVTLNQKRFREWLDREEAHLATRK